MMNNLKEAREAIDRGENVDIFEAQMKDMREWSSLESENGSVETPEQKVAMTQQPYIDGPAGETPFYRAQAVDKSGEEYEVIWSVVDHWQELEDESEMADWNNPAEVNKI